MAQRGGRITCPRCGANNFDTQSACWKCGAALSAAGGPAQTLPIMPTPGPIFAQGERLPAAPAPIAYAQSTGDTGVARRAAIALALTIPFIGLPVGWVFMMIEDARKQEIGRICAVWSMIGLVLHMFLMFAGMKALTATLAPFLVSAMQSKSGGTPGGSDSGLPRDLGQ